MYRYTAGALKDYHTLPLMPGGFCHGEERKIFWC
jgi:hypothetical protein